MCGIHLRRTYPGLMFSTWARTPGEPSFFAAVTCARLYAKASAANARNFFLEGEGRALAFLPWATHSVGENATICDWRLAGHFPHCLRSRLPPPPPTGGLCFGGWSLAVAVGWGGGPRALACCERNACTCVVPSGSEDVIRRVAIDPPPSRSNRCCRRAFLPWVIDASLRRGSLVVLGV